MNDSKTLKKIIAAIIAFILMLVIAVVVSLLIHKRESEPASATVQNGLSAYELAVKEGYDGSVQDWLGSLAGKSAYDIAVENGYTGSE